MHSSPEPRARLAIDALARAADRDYLGEPVSQLEHALQCAQLASRAGAPDTEILAALFHDIGHLVAPSGTREMAGLGVHEHERIGAEFLRGLGFAEAVCDLVGSHVAAKRYLALRKHGYFDALSPASRGTLAHQGGVMSETEAAHFERDVSFAARLRLRVWDERAKDAGETTPALASYEPLIRRHLGGAK